MSNATEANNRWRKENRKVIQLTVTEETNRWIREGAEIEEKSITKYILDCIKEHESRRKIKYI